jgi:hypothetical protein
MLLPEFRQPMPQKSFAATQRPASSFVPKASISSAVALAALFLAPAASAIAQQPVSPVLLDAMTAELHRAFSSLGRLPSGKPDGDQQQPPYFLSYSVSDASYVGIRAQYGALVQSTANRIRVADVQVRLGDPKLDNTHGHYLQTPLSGEIEPVSRLRALSSYNT